MVHIGKPASELSRLTDLVGGTIHVRRTRPIKLLRTPLVQQNGFKLEDIGEPADELFGEGFRVVYQENRAAEGVKPFDVLLSLDRISCALGRDGRQTTCNQ